MKNVAQRKKIGVQKKDAKNIDPTKAHRSRLRLPLEHAYELHRQSPIYSAIDCGFGPRPPRYTTRVATYGGDTNLYSGIWRSGSGAHATWVTTDWDDFTAKWDEFGRQGLRMDDFETFTVGPARVYSGIFRAGKDKHAAWVTSDWDDFTAKWNAWGKDGLRMHDFESYVHGGQRFFAGVFRAGSGGHTAWFTADWSEFSGKWDTWGEQGLRMHDFETYIDGGRRMYAGIFRAGGGGHAAWFTDDWSEFTSKWDTWGEQGLRMHDYETYVDGDTRTFAGVFRAGSGPHYAWLGVDWENFISKRHELESGDLRLIDMEVTSGSCPAACVNQAAMPAAIGTYDYGITATATHCEGVPGSCPPPASGDMVIYRQPIIDEGGERYLRLSALDVGDQFLTLPFSDSTLGHNGWLYSPGSWHHAVDYGKSAKTFEVRSAAAGTVVHVGWDIWSGNTVVVSHDVAGVTDAYRTIYMHLKNGADSDCSAAWDETVTPFEASADPDVQALGTEYRAYLEATGCPETEPRSPDESRWGSADEAIAVMPGQQLERGDLIALAGSTGPGGCGCMGNGGTGPNNHLHIFFARRDPSDDRWYLFDPYGIYGPSQCYPSGITDRPEPPCTRYPVAWKGGGPQFP